MPPPMRMASTLASRFSMTSILSETLAPPRIATKGFGGIGERLAHVVELLLHEQARRRRAGRSA